MVAALPKCAGVFSLFIGWHNTSADRGPGFPGPFYLGKDLMERSKSTPEEQAYQAWLFTRQQDAEALCRHCGACCGAWEDPCVHLLISPEGRSSCNIYTDRFGLRKTVAGHSFTCVPVRVKLGTSWPGDERCGYKRVGTFPNHE